MKTTALLLTIFTFVMMAPLAFAQNYNAGYNSGAGGAENTHVGAYAGQYDTKRGNSYIGWAAGQFSSGYYNSYVGRMAGYWNAGWFNSYVGYGAGAAVNSTGSNNSFLGYSAGAYNLGGSYNSFVGSAAGMQNTSGFANTFLGASAGYFTSTGGYNNFVGMSAGYHNIDGAYNSFVGAYAGYANTSGYFNNFSGYQAGYSNTSGYNNSFLGYQAGYANTLGYSNSFLGAYTGFSTTLGTQNTFLGRGSGYVNTTGGYNTFVGNYSGGTTNITGNYNTVLGYYASIGANNLTNATAIGSLASVTASNSMVLGRIKGINGATADTKVGIRTTAPAYTLHVNGTAAKPGGGSWTVASDQRLKRDIADFKDGLALIGKIRPVWFRYNGKAALPTDKQYVGVIAQEMQQIAPYTVGEFVYQDTTGKEEKYLDYDANAVTYMLVNAVKEVDQKYTQQLKEKDAQLASQQQQIGALTDRLLRLEALLTQQPNAATSAENASARLWQNEPNPTDGTTVIRYFIPQEAGSAQLKVYTMKGEEVHSTDLTQKGNGQVQLSGRELAAGVYVYQLLINGKSVASKKLVLAK